VSRLEQLLTGLLIVSLLVAGAFAGASFFASEQ
jgi:hypothetical protein